MATVAEHPGIGRASRDIVSRAQAAAPMASPPGLASTPDLWVLLKALKRCWLRAGVCSVAGAVVVAALTWLTVPASQATVQALIKIDASQKWVFNTAEPQVQFQTYQLNQTAILKSRSVLEAALHRPEVAALPLVRRQGTSTDWLEKELQIDWPSGSEYLRIGLSGEDPAEVAMLLKGITTSYLKEAVALDQSKRNERRDQLQAIYDGYQTSLETKRQEIHDLEKRYGPGDPQATVYKHRVAMDTLYSAQQELQRVRSTLRAAQIDLDVHKAKEKAFATARVADVTVDEALKKDPAAEPLYRKRMQVLDDMAEVRRVYRPDRVGPYLRDLEKQLEQIDRGLAELRDRVRPSMEAVQREKARQQFEETLAGLDERVVKLRQEEKELSANVQHLAGEKVAIQENSVDLDVKRAAIAREEAVANEVGKEVERLNVELKAPARISVVEEASVTRTSDRKRQFKMAGMTGLGTLGLALFGFAWREFQARRVHGDEDIAQGLGMKVLGTLPPAGNERGMDASPLADAVDSVRTMLLRTARSEGLRSVLITSAVGGEGKTTLATQLAASLGRAGVRTLLIDGDLRNPSAHAALGLPGEPGLSELLRGEGLAVEAIQPAHEEGLWFLPAGRGDARAIQALASERLGTVLDGLKARFDFVVIDSSPVLPVADALSLGQYADAVLVSVLREVSQVRKIHQTCQRLGQFGIRLLGAVVNGVREDMYGPASRYTKRARR